MLDCKTVKDYIERKYVMLGIPSEKKEQILKIWEREAVHTERLYLLNSPYLEGIDFMYDTRLDTIIKMEERERK